MTNSLIFRFSRTLIAFFSLLLIPIAANAAVTEWHDLGGGKVRLVVVYDPVEGQVEGIIDVELQPGWVTYWRNPGESGIPPIFDFSASQGVAVKQPEYPAPKAQYKAGLTSYVYTNRVSFPFKATPVISPLSGTLQLDLVMGVCEEICIPATATLTQDLGALNRTDLVSNRLIQNAWKQIPSKEVKSSDKPEILSAKHMPEGKVSVLVKVPKEAEDLTLLAEGGKSWFFNPAKVSKREGSQVSFLLDVGNLPKGADLSNTPLRFTLSADGVSSEKSLIVQ